MTGPTLVGGCGFNRLTEVHVMDPYGVAITVKPLIIIGRGLYMYTRVTL